MNGAKTGRAALVIAILHRAASIGLHAKLAADFRPISKSREPGLVAQIAIPTRITRHHRLRDQARSHGLGAKTL